LVHSDSRLPETDDCEVKWGGDWLGATLALFCDIIFAANHAKSRIRT